MKSFFSANGFWEQPGLAIIRMITGAFLIYHGWEVFDSLTMKGYLDWDQFNGATGKLLVYLGKSAELLGGLLLFMGLLTRIAALLIAGTLLYISFFVGHGKVWYEDQHPFLFVLLAMLFFFTGPGSWSLDKRIFRSE